MIKFVLLDLDDTLFDFHAAERAALRQALSEMGVAADDNVIELYSRINAEHWKMLERGEMTREQILTGRFDALYREMGVCCDSVKTQSIYEYRLSLEHPMLDGAIEVLEELSESYCLYAVSNGTATVQDRRITDSGIGKYFRGIFISQRVGADKPSREFFDYCFSHVEGFDKAEAIIVGDSQSSDILGGINAGIRTCLLNPHGHAVRVVPDREIRSIRELPSLLKKL